MKQSLQLKLGHQLTMTPQLQQAIRLLQLSSLELHSEIQTALEGNPLLDLSEDPNEEEDKINTAVGSEGLLSAVHEEEFAVDFRTSLRSMGTSETHGSDFENLNSAPFRLRDHLMWQMELTPFSESDAMIAMALIEAINENGFLSSSIDDIILTLKPSLDVDESEVVAVLHRIQQFDPIGVGARDIGEYLKIQIDHLPADTPWRNKARALVCHHLDLLGKRDYPALKRRLSLSSESLQNVISFIQSLNPRPDIQIGNKNVDYIVPDVVTYKKMGSWYVILNPECTPKLQINRYYASLIRKSDTSTDNQYLRQNLQEAQWFMKSIQNRNETLLKVAKCIVNEQSDFLEKGEEAMKPLILHDIAKALNLHESTISRITTCKYLYTPRGTFELKYFFSSQVQTELGEGCSSTAIRAHLKKMIASENPKKPLSDHKLSKLLSGLGIKIARRTVAKYRELMQIPPSNERKKF